MLHTVWLRPCSPGLDQTVNVFQSKIRQIIALKVFQNWAESFDCRFVTALSESTELLKKKKYSTTKRKSSHQLILSRQNLSESDNQITRPNSKNSQRNKLTRFYSGKHLLSSLVLESKAGAYSSGVGKVTSLYLQILRLVFIFNALAYYTKV